MAWKLRYAVKNNHRAQRVEFDTADGSNLNVFTFLWKCNYFSMI